MAMFGAKGGATAGSIAGFNPAGPTWVDKAGLVGDILSDNHNTRDRLDQDFQFQQQQYAAQHPMPVNVDGNLVQFDPMTGGVKTLLAKPAAAPTGFAGELAAAGYAPGSPDFLRLAQQHAVNAATAPPIVQHNADGTTTLYQAGMIPRTPTNAPAVGSLVADPRKSGGAAPSSGPGGFPLYPNGH